ncbi:hypothetical protein BGZ91_002960 [Linnemannia elongata]|nr:hypothetical protein BGZ91_002960 [Linnemannia elongata]
MEQLDDIDETFMIDGEKSGLDSTRRRNSCRALNNDGYVEWKRIRKEMDLVARDVTRHLDWMIMERQRSFDPQSSEYLRLDYATKLARTIFDRQEGKPVVKYSHISDKNTWKVEFFGPQPEIRLLRESSPLTRAGNHPSLFDVESPLFRRNLLSEPSIVQFLCDRVKSSSDFEQQLRAVIDLSKTDASAAIAATNAITILVRAGVSFNGADLRGAKIPGADLSGGQFDSAKFQGANLTGADLSRSWLRQVDLSRAQLKDVWFGELPYLEMEGTVRSCVYSPDGTMLAAGFEKDGLDIYSTASRARILQIRHTRGVLSVVFSPDSQQIAFGGYNGTVRVWDLTSGEELLAMEGHTKRTKSVNYSPCGKLIASASLDTTVRLWSSQTGESLLVLKGHASDVTSVVFSPDGRQLVSGSWDETIRFWDPETGEPGRVLRSSLGEVDSLAYSPDGKWIASGHRGGLLQL